MKTHQKTMFHWFWAIGGCLLLAGPSFAAKPAPKPPPEPPPPTSASYRYIELGSLGNLGVYNCKINAAGVVAGTYRNVVFSPDGIAIESSHPFVAIPKDSDGNGLPDVWPITELGIPSVMEVYDEQGNLAYDTRNVQFDINDHGDIVLNFGKDLFVLQPDPSGQYVPEGLNGFNPWMIQVGLPAVPCSDEYIFLDFPSINNNGMITFRRHWEKYVGPPEEDPVFQYVGVDEGILIRGEDTVGNDGIADSWNRIEIDENGQQVYALMEYLLNKPDKYGGMMPVYPFSLNDAGWIGGASHWTYPCLLRPRWIGESLVYWADDNQDGANDLVIPLCPGNVGGVRDINSKGKIVGYQYIKPSMSYDFNAMIWEVADNGTVNATVFKKTNTTDYWFQAINDQDVIVGRQTVTTRTGSLTSAIIVTGTTIKDLRTLTDQAAALSGLKMEALDINNAGQIVGITYYDGVTRAFIAVPNANP